MNDKKNTIQKRRIGMSIGETTLDLCDRAKKKGYTKTRSEFIDEAVKMYSTWLDGKSYIGIIAPAYESTVESIISKEVRKLSRNLFKLSVEVSMLMHAIAYAYNMDDADLEEMRTECIKEVKELSGTINFEEIVDIAQGDE